MSSFGNTSDLVIVLFKYKDKLEQIIRKKPSVTPQTKIPLNNPDKYPSLWFDNQEDLVIKYLKHLWLKKSYGKLNIELKSKCYLINEINLIFYSKIYWYFILHIYH